MATTIKANIIHASIRADIKSATNVRVNTTSPTLKTTTTQNVIKATIKGVGPKGDTGAASTVAGPQGEDGYTPIKNVDYFDGSNGTNGADGQGVEIQVSGGFIQWKLTNDVSWTNLIATSTLVGATGATGNAGTNGTNGADGTQIELQKTATYIQWRLVGGSWANLVLLADLKGDQGEIGLTGLTGNDGYTPMKNVDYFDGTNGTNGVDGDDAYVYIAYASDASGTGFTLTFDPALNYIAVRHTTSLIALPVASDFTGLWKNYKGATGAAGAGSGDVLGPATNSDEYIPQWDGANSKTLKAGVAIPAGGLAGETEVAGKVDKVTGSRLITSAESTLLGNTSGANSGDSATPAETTTTVGTLINGATAKTSAVDADYLPLMDSQASNLMKKLSWAYVKSILKTYFDGLYTLANLGGLGLHATADDSSKAGGYSVSATPTANNIPVLDANAKFPLVNILSTAKALVYLGSDQAITNATWTKVLLDTEIYDVGSNFDSTTNHRFVAPVTGYYQVNVHNMFLSMSANIDCWVAIRKNGTEYSGQEWGSQGTVAREGMSLSDVVYLAATDYVELYVFQSSGGNKSVASGVGWTTMSVHLLSV